MNPDSTFSAATLPAFCDRLAALDSDLASIIGRYSYPPMWSRPNTFESLIWIILEQQVSLASAKAALEKLRQYVGDITPEAVLVLTDEELKACYFSRQKTAYARALARALVSDHLDLAALERQSSQKVRAQLTAIKGIGDWTVDVYLIFVLHRLDVFPMGDLAAVNALRRLKNVPVGASRQTLQSIVDTWQPYRTIAAMLLWHYYLSHPKMPKRK